MMNSPNLKNSDTNPCIEEGNLSIDCLERNAYDYAKCQWYFLNYRQCRAFWNRVRKDRKKAGILPSMPCAEERMKIMQKRKEGEYVFNQP